MVLVSERKLAGVSEAHVLDVDLLVQNASWLQNGHRHGKLHELRIHLSWHADRLE